MKKYFLLKFIAILILTMVVCWFVSKSYILTTSVFWIFMFPLNERYRRKRKRKAFMNSQAMTIDPEKPFPNEKG